MSAAMDLRPLHADSMDIPETLDDDNIALLNPNNNNNDNANNRRSPPRSSRMGLGRKSFHGTSSSHTTKTKASRTSSTSSAKGSSSRRHSTSVVKPRSTSPKDRRDGGGSSDQQSLLVPLAPPMTSLRRAVTADNATAQLSKSPNRRLFKRRTSIDMVQSSSNHHTGGSSSQKQKQQPRCPATVSSIAKPSLMEKLKVDAKLRANRGMPLPLPSIAGDSLQNDAEESSKDNTFSNNMAGMDDTATSTSAPDEASEQIDGDDTTSGFFQFDPTKADNLVSLVRTDEASIFAMQQVKKSDGDKESKQDGDNCKSERGDATNDSAKDISSEQDNDLPPLVEVEGPEDVGTKGIGIFGPNAKFILQADHARGHVEDEGDEPPLEEMDTVAIPQLTRRSSKGNKKGLKEESGSRVESVMVDDSDSCPSQEESSSSNNDYRAPQNAKGLLQFNHTTLDGLDLASCAGEDTSIFQMNSISTLDVPAMMTTDPSGLDKQLLQLQTKTSKEKKSIFSGAMKKAKSFKRPKAWSKLPIDSTDHTSSSTSDNVNVDKTDNPKGNLERSSSEGNVIEANTSLENDEGIERKNSDPDKDATRRRRDRVKERRESTRDKSTDNANDEERKERLRKRDALRKAACTMNLPSRAYSTDNNPTRTPRQGRRRLVKAGDTAKLVLDHSSDEVRDGKDATADEGKDPVNHSRRRSAMQKAQSVRLSSTSITPRKALVRRTASNDDGVAVGPALPFRTGGSKARRSSEAKSRLEQDDGRDKSCSREGLERSQDKRQRRTRRPKDGEGKEEDEMDKSKESVDVSKGRRRGGERRQSRRSRKDKDQDGYGGDEMDRSAVSVEGIRMDVPASSGARRTRRASSMRRERTVDANLAGAGDIVHSSFHSGSAPRKAPPIVDKAS